MKKLKFLLPLILALAMALTIPFAAACKKDNKNNGDDGNGGNETVVTTEVLSISLNTDNAKTEYYTGEAFNSAGLVVNATVKRSDKTDTETVNVSTLAKISSGAYNRNKMGTYTIGVSYEGKTANYSVNVTEAKLNWAPAQDFKDLYLVGEELQNLTEHGSFTLQTQRPGEESATISDVTSSVTIDSSAYDNETEGTYAIVASYRVPRLAAGFTANYPVSTSVYTNVIETREGLNVELAAGVDEIFPLSATTPTATIDPSKIVVKRVDAYGTVIDTPLNSNEYKVELWKENEKVSDSHLNSGIYTGLTGGVYQLWAYAESLNSGSDYELSGFATIIVADEVVSIEVNQNGYTSQAVGLDYLSSKWTYTVNYISGVSKNVTTSDVELVMFNTKVVGSNKSATIRYTDINAAGIKKLVTTTVNYEITASSLTSLPTETFIVKNEENPAEKFATVTEGSKIVDNSLFTLTTQAEMKWTEAKGSATSANTRWINQTLQDGATKVTFDAGLSQSTVTAVGEETPSVTFTANNDITLIAYITLCNATYNSNREGALIATVTHKDGSFETKEITVGSARESMKAEDLTFDLYEGDVLVIKIKNNGTNTATMWLFGAEATGYKEVGGGD